MPRVSDHTEDSDEGQKIAARRKEIFKQEWLPKLAALPRAADLVAAIKDRGLVAVAASSAKKEELEPLLRIAGAHSLLDGATSSDDAEESKPDPDIVQAALKRAGAKADQAIMIGDTPYDIEAAGRAGVRTIAFRSGGWQDAELTGALAIYDGPWDLLNQLEQSPLGVIHRASKHDDRAATPAPEET
jgi:HAD superfamily hydrolase (TIGR01509 family)